MRYSIEPNNRICVKAYGFLSFAKNMGKYLSSKYGQKLLDSAKKKSTTDAIKSASTWANQKTAEVTGDLIRNKIADKITSVSKRSSKELHSAEHSKELQNNESEIAEERYISPEKRQQIFDELRLV